MRLGKPRVTEPEDDSLDNESFESVDVNPAGSSNSSSVGIAAIGPAILPPPPVAGKMLLKMMLLLPKLPVGLLDKAGKMALAKMGGQVGVL
jgi:hypothetical protein